jgi:two-component sensor histidine kinase
VTRILNAASWRRWPLLASLLAIIFIGYGLSLVSRARIVQTRIATEVRLIDELGRLNDDLHQLGTAHRVDQLTYQGRWDLNRQHLLDRATALSSNHPGVPGMGDLPVNLGRVLHAADSLHRESLSTKRSSDERHNAEAVLHLMLQRAQKVLDRTARRVHEEGLGDHTGSLSAQWTEAQVLLVAACLMAVVFAWLVGVSNRLLLQSRLRSQQLEQAQNSLERTNRELRETMLSKEEKEVMIKEIHHRVKNNLQIVKSLIRFQMDQVSDPRTLELFNECVNRVSAMALVHEQTYLSKDLANIDVRTYLSHLVRDLCHAYTVDTKLEIDSRIDVETLGVDTLIPLGLLINEIISNALKYAFNGRAQGTIMVHIAGDPLSGLHMRIGDDGVGLPDPSKWQRPQSLGMELIHTLAGQLDATVSLADGPGTVYTIVSRPVEVRKRA